MMAGVRIRRIIQFDASEPLTTHCREVGVRRSRPHGFQSSRRMSRASQLAVAAARMVRADAGLPEQLPDPDRTGVLVGTPPVAWSGRLSEMDTFRRRGMRAVSPFIAIL